MNDVARLETLGMLTEDDAPAGSREILSSTRARMGMVPNMWAEMANSPGLLRTYVAGYNDFRTRSGFDPVEQEVVFLTISRFHECSYCVAAHSAVADRSKVPTEVTEAIRSGEPIPDDRMRALADFTTTMVASRGRPAPEELKQFLAAGYTERQALEIILAIGVKTISNYTNHLFGTPIDAVWAHREWRTE